MLALGRPHSAAQAPAASHSRKSLPGSDVDTTAEGTPLLASGAASASGSTHDSKAASACPAVAGSVAGSGANELSSNNGQPDRQLHMASLATGQMLCTIDFWLLFSQFVVGSGVCLAYLNNLGQLVVSLGGDHDGQVVFVSLFSVANAAGESCSCYQLNKCGVHRQAALCLAAGAQYRSASAACRMLAACTVTLQTGVMQGCIIVSLSVCCLHLSGRLMMGYIPEQHLHAKGTPRTMFLTLTAALTAASCLAVAYANLSHLYVISILLGLAFGAHWSLLPSITSDLFGLKHFAANYTTLQVSSMIVVLHPAVSCTVLIHSSVLCRLAAVDLQGWQHTKPAPRDAPRLRTHVEPVHTC